MQMEPESLPPYTPGMCHCSLVFLSQKDSQTQFQPALLKLHATRLDLCEIQHSVAIRVAHCFNSRRTSDLPTELVVKSRRATREALQRAEVGSQAQRNRASSKIGKWLSSKLSKSTRSAERGDYSHVTLDPNMQSDVLSRTVLNELDFKPEINDIFKQFNMDRQERLETFCTGKIVQSWSLQELLYFGSAVDIYDMPFLLRLVFPQGQYLLSCYNGYDMVSIFYKLNISKELSLDIDQRSLEPLDYCLPRRRRTNGRRRRRARANRRLLSGISEDIVTRPRADTIDSIDIEEDILEELEEQLAIQLEDELLLDEEEELEEEEEELEEEIEGSPPLYSTTSTSSIARSNSLFSNIDVSRVSTQETTSTGPPSYHRMNRSLNAMFGIHEEVKLNYSSQSYGKSKNDKYDDMVFALKCLKACREKPKWKC